MKTFSSILAIALLLGATDVATAANGHKLHRRAAADYMALSPKANAPAAMSPISPADEDDSRGSLTGGPSGGLGGY